MPELALSLIAALGFQPPDEPAAGPKEPAGDLIQPMSVWVGGARKWTLTILERQGEAFRAQWQTDSIDREVRGTIKDGKISWLAKDVRAEEGGVGGDNVGVIDGETINLNWEDAKGHSGSFELRLERRGKSITKLADSEPTKTPVSRHEFKSVAEMLKAIPANIVPRGVTPEPSGGVKRNKVTEIQLRAMNDVLNEKVLDQPAELSFEASGRFPLKLRAFC